MSDIAIVRRALPSDARAIAEVHVRSWRETYPGIIPAEVIERMSVDEREKVWAERLMGLGPDLILVAELAGQVVGFASGGPHRLKMSLENGVSEESMRRFSGELYAIYLLKDHQHLGLGRQLFDGVVAGLVADGHKNMVVWVLKENPTCKFYERMGGKFVVEKKVKIGTWLDELAYGYEELS